MTTEEEIEMDYSSFEGLWKTKGYSSIIEIKDGMVRRHEYTKISCILSFPQFIPLSALPWKFWIDEHNQLVYKSQGESAEKSAVRIESMDDYLHRDILGPIEDPEANFEVFWHTFAENFPFFHLYGSPTLDWNAVYQQYRPQVTPQTTKDQLFEIFHQLILPIKDRHTMIHNDKGDTRSGGTYPDWFDLKRASEIKKEIGQKLASGVPASGEFAWMVFGQFLEVIKTKYLQDKIQEKYHRLMFYGRISDSLGYINILRFMNYDNVYDGVIVSHAIDAIIAELADVDSLIVDIRYNLGGYDSHAFIVANRFADQKRLALTKQAWEHGEMSPLMHAYVKPEGFQQFTKPVVLLTSNYTCSGAEIFTMAMTALPNVTVVGKNTIGCHSDTFDRVLPNGWRFSLSNEIYLMHGKTCFERIGLLPNYEIGMNQAEFAHNKDEILEFAIDLLKKKRDEFK